MSQNVIIRKHSASKAVTKPAELIPWPDAWRKEPYFHSFTKRAARLGPSKSLRRGQGRRCLSVERVCNREGTKLKKPDLLLQ